MDKIDWVVYINLDRRTDRREEMEAQLEKVGLRAERFSAIAHSVGIVGCGYSHLAVLKEAREKKCRHVLIMEDDLDFLITREEMDAEMNQLWNHDPPIEFDVVKIDYLLQRSEETPYPFLGRAIESQTASGYVVAGAYLDTLIKLYEESFPLLESTGQHWIYANDQVWKQLQKKDRWFYFKKRFGKQRDGFSDNSNCFQKRT
jgi:glycosyl transferase family 25